MLKGVFRYPVTELHLSSRFHGNILSAVSLAMLLLPRLSALAPARLCLDLWVLFHSLYASPLISWLQLPPKSADNLYTPGSYASCPLPSRAPLFSSLHLDMWMAHKHKTKQNRKGKIQFMSNVPPHLPIFSDLYFLFL